VVITGTLPGVCYADGMTRYLNAQGIRIFDYPQFAMKLRDRVRSSAATLAAEAGVTIEHIAKSHIVCAPSGATSVTSHASPLARTRFVTDPLRRAAAVRPQWPEPAPNDEAPAAGIPEFVTVATSSQLRTWAVENRAMAELTTNSETAAGLRSAADHLDALAEAKEAEDGSTPP
jgi:hypothetical protein